MKPKNKFSSIIKILLAIILIILLVLIIRSFVPAINHLPSSNNNESKVYTPEIKRDVVVKEYATCSSDIQSELDTNKYNYDGWEIFEDNETKMSFHYPKELSLSHTEGLVYPYYFHDITTVNNSSETQTNGQMGDGFSGGFGFRFIKWNDSNKIPNEMDFSYPEPPCKFVVNGFSGFYLQHYGGLADGDMLLLDTGNNYAILFNYGYTERNPNDLSTLYKIIASIKSKG